MAQLRSFLSVADAEEIVAAIREAELRTSGEIRVRLERTAGADPLQTARAAFESMGMRKTALRNGVLFLLAVEDRKFAVLGDDGINQRVPADFWNAVRDEVLRCFAEGKFGQGLAAGIRRAGEQLARYFPRAADDVNELPDAISFADEEA